MFHSPLTCCLHPSSRELCHDYMSMGVSASLLAQTFSILMRQLVDILTALTSHLHPPTPPDVLPTMDGEPEALRDYLWAELHGVWVWLFTQVDMVECQVRVGNAMESSVQPQGERHVCLLLCVTTCLNLNLQPGQRRPVKLWTLVGTSWRISCL